MNFDLGTTPNYWNNIDEEALASLVPASSSLADPQWWQYTVYPVIESKSLTSNTSYDGGTIEIPAYLLTSEAVDEIKIQKEDGEVDDLGACYIKEVNRDGDFLSFKAIYANDRATTKEYDYEEGMIVIVTATPYENMEPYITRFSVTKKAKFNVFGWKIGGYNTYFTLIEE